MSESSCLGSVTRVSDLAKSEKYAYESIGQGVPFTELKIVSLDSKGATVPRNVDGEVCLRGYHVMKGYWNEPEKTAEVLDDQAWFKTGDIASMDDNGSGFSNKMYCGFIIS
jgi:fatty-acyl-CoA synthase